jgi:hypothetical protein
MKIKILFLLAISLTALSSFDTSIRLAGIVIYEGSCQVYKEHVIGNKRQESLVGRTTGQVVVNESKKTISVYINGKSIISGQSYTTSYTGDGEGVSYQTVSDYSIASYPRSKTFHIIVSAPFGSNDDWYEYYITNYSTRR